MAHTAYEGSKRTLNEHLPNWVTLCNPMGGHTEKLTNLTPHPQLSFCVFCGKKKNLQSILTASLFLGVCIKPLCFEDHHNELS